MVTSTVMKVTMRPIGAIKPYEKNPRQNDGAVDAVAKSIKEFGWRQPIVVDENDEIIVGHTRWRAAQQLGQKKVPVHTATDLTPEQIRAYRLADNATGEIAEWDMDLLANEVLALQESDYALDMLGFDETSLSRILDAGNEEVPDPDATPPLPKNAKTELGDLITLGEHRLLCGDACVQGDVDRLFGDEELTCDAVICDPPYGVNYVGGTKDALTIQNDSPDTLQPLLEASLELAFNRCRPGGAWYVCAPAGPQFIDFGFVLRKLKVWRQTIVWVKDAFVLGRSDFQHQHEMMFYGWSPGAEPTPPAYLEGSDPDDELYEHGSLLYGWKPGAAHTAPADRKQTSVWHVARPRVNKEHPTKKPVELMAKAMGISTLRDEIVYDPFAGSGTTLITAEYCRRRCFAMEIDPLYCDVIVQRWEEKTGGTATREQR